MSCSISGNLRREHQMFLTAMLQNRCHAEHRIWQASGSYEIKGEKKKSYQSQEILSPKPRKEKRDNRSLHKLQKIELQLQKTRINDGFQHFAKFTPRHF